jgi:hypothetical protein
MRWKLVPVEPTPEMVRATGNVPHESTHDCDNAFEVARKRYRPIYAAMLLASPPVPDEVVERVARAIATSRGWLLPNDLAMARAALAALDTNDVD